MDVRIISVKDVRERKQDLKDAEASVKLIVAEVKEKGDSALRYYAKRFDSSKSENFFITKDEIKAAYSKLDQNDIRAIKKAIRNVRKFAFLCKYR